MFIEYTDECYGCKDRSEEACDKCIEKKIALNKLKEDRKKKLKVAGGNDV